MLAVAVGCGGAKADLRTGGAGSGRWVRQLTISGNKHLSDRQIRNGLATEPQSIFGTSRSRLDPYVLERDRARIESFYQRQGYFSARVAKVVVRNVGTDKVDVRFVVVEGDPFRIVSVRATGIPEACATSAAIRRQLGRLRRGAVFRHELYLQIKAKVLRALQRAGYAHAEVNGRVAVDRRSGSVDVLLEVEAGSLVHYGNTVVKGTHRIPKSAILARLAWHKGDTYDPRDLEETQARLYRLGVFNTARVEVQREGAPKIADVTVSVTEAPRRELRLGAGVHVDQAYWLLRGRFGYTRHGVWHPLNTLTTEARPGYAILRGAQGRAGPTVDASATLSRDDLWWPLLRGDAGVSYSFQQLEAYSTQGPGARLGLSRQFLSERLRITAGWQYRLLQIFQIAPAIDAGLRDELGLQSPYRLGFFDQSVSYDGRDVPVNPTRGYYAEVRVEESGRAAGSAFSYMRTTPEVRGYISPLGKRLVLAARTRLGMLLTGKLPISQRYFAGGANSHRGFAQRRLSPTASAAGESTVPIGGEALLETGAEARYELMKVKGQWLELAVFLDGGDVTMQPSDLDVTNLHWAAGGGIRYRTFVGPLRFDVGYRLNRTGANEPSPGSRWAFHFTFGESF